MKFYFANRTEVIAQVTQAVQQLARCFPEVRQVVLFGSYARDSYTPGSDVDLLILLDESDRPFLDRVPKYLPDSLKISVDVFPYTLSEIEDMLEIGNHLIRRALNEGETIYEREIEKP